MVWYTPVINIYLYISNLEIIFISSGILRSPLTYARYQRNNGYAYTTNICKVFKLPKQISGLCSVTVHLTVGGRHKGV